MLSSKQSKQKRLSSYLPNYLKPRSSFLPGITPRCTTDISDWTHALTLQTSTLLYSQDSPPSTWAHQPGTWESLESVLSLTCHIQLVSKSCWFDPSACLLQFHCHCFTWGQRFLLVFLQGHCLPRAFLAFGHVSLKIFLHRLPAPSIQRATLTFSFPCLSSIKPSQLPEVVVLKVWSLVSSAQNYSLHCLISELCYNGYISISASVTHYFNYVFVCLRCWLWSCILFLLLSTEPQIVPASW